MDELHKYHAATPPTLDPKQEVESSFYARNLAKASKPPFQLDHSEAAGNSSASRRQAGQIHPLGQGRAGDTPLLSCSGETQA